MSSNGSVKRMLQAAECPICGGRELRMAEARRFLFFQRSDLFRCDGCMSTFKVNTDSERIRFEHVPNPYSYFEATFKTWITPSQAKALAHSIREQTPNALDYLEGASRYAWQVWMILQGRGEASPGNISFRLAWDRPKSVREARAVLEEAVDYQAQIREVIATVAEEVADLQEAADRQDPPAKSGKQIEPLQQVLRGFNALVHSLEGVKFRMQSHIDQAN